MEKYTSGNGLSQMRGKRSDIFEEEVMVINTSPDADGYTFYYILTATLKFNF